VGAVWAISKNYCCHKGFTMTKNEFMMLCYEQLIDPQCALEDENLRQAIAEKDWERVRYIIMNEF
jgi:hypothetical protein